MNKARTIFTLSILALFMSGCQSEPESTPTATAEQFEVPTETSPPILSPSPPSTITPSTAPTLTPSPRPTDTPVTTLPLFEPADCQFSPSNISYLSCGYVTVPENRDKPQSGTIRLHVAVARSLDREPEADPLIFLSGGPGSHALEWLFYSVRNYTDILRNRDVIFFDPRGIGFSEPSLDCPEVMDTYRELLDQPLEDHEWIQRMVTANLGCRERLLDSGIDLEAYNSAEMAADVIDIRQALGYEAVNLFGVSYGTRTALTVMRDFPEAVRSAVLDSPVPLEVNLIGADAPASDRAMNMLFERCAAEPSCAAAYPDLPAALNELVATLNAEPVTIPVMHLVTGDYHDVWVDGGILGASLVEALYNYETAIYLPKMIYDSLKAGDGSYDTLATSLEIYLFYGDYSSEGTRHSVLCSDEGTFTTLDAALVSPGTAHPAIAEVVNRDSEMVFRICDEWGAKVAPPLENLPVHSDIPTLVLSGELDPVTPPSWGIQLASTLDNAFYVEFPWLGHSVFAERSCARDIVADFLADPTTEPDSSCTRFITFTFVTN